MKISLSKIFSFFKVFKFSKKKKATSLSTESWIDQLKRNTVNEVTENIKKSYDHINIKQYLINIEHSLPNTLEATIEELYYLTSSHMTSNDKYENLQEIKNVFSLSLGESTGITLPNEELEKLGKYYYENFYTDESHQQHYNAAKLK